jgi:hypothetical protein
VTRSHRTADLGDGGPLSHGEPGRNKRHRAVPPQHPHHSGRMLCLDMGRVNMSRVGAKHFMGAQVNGDIETGM